LKRPQLREAESSIKEITMKTLRFDTSHPSSLSPNWVGQNVCSTNRGAKEAKSPRERKEMFRSKVRWIELGIETLAPEELRLEYQLVCGRVLLLVTIYGDSRVWQAHTPLEWLSPEIRNQILAELGDPREFHKRSRH
jgi:hypothetical protein